MDIISAERMEAFSGLLPIPLRVLFGISMEGQFLQTWMGMGEQTSLCVEQVEVVEWLPGKVALPNLKSGDLLTMNG